MLGNKKKKPGGRWNLWSTPEDWEPSQIRSAQQSASSTDWLVVKGSSSSVQFQIPVHHNHSAVSNLHDIAIVSNGLKYISDGCLLSKITYLAEEEVLPRLQFGWFHKICVIIIIFIPQHHTIHRPETYKVLTEFYQWLALARYRKFENW